MIIRQPSVAFLNACGNAQAAARRNKKHLHRRFICCPQLPNAARRLTCSAVLRLMIKEKVIIDPFPQKRRVCTHFTAFCRCENSTQFFFIVREHFQINPGVHQVVHKNIMREVRLIIHSMLQVCIQHLRGNVRKVFLLHVSQKLLCRFAPCHRQSCHKINDLRGIASRFFQYGRKLCIPQTQGFPLSAFSAQERRFKGLTCLYGMRAAAVLFCLFLCRQRRRRFHPADRRQEGEIVSLGFVGTAF